MEGFYFDDNYHPFCKWNILTLEIADKYIMGINYDNKAVKESKLNVNGEFDSPLDQKTFPRSYNGFSELSDLDKEYLLHRRQVYIEEHLERISKNVRFFFWLIIISIGLTILWFAVFV